MSSPEMEENAVTAAAIIIIVKMSSLDCCCYVMSLFLRTFQAPLLSGFMVPFSTFYVEVERNEV